jgi:hypothetical protein
MIQNVSDATKNKPSLLPILKINDDEMSEELVAAREVKEELEDDEEDDEDEEDEDEEVNEYEDECGYENEGGETVLDEKNELEDDEEYDEDLEDDIGDDDDDEGEDELYIRVDVEDDGKYTANIFMLI